MTARPPTRSRYGERVRPAPFSVKYYSGASGGTDITSAVTAGTYTLSNVAADSSQYLRLVVTAATNAPSGTSRGFLVTAISAADTTKRDAVKGLGQRKVGPRRRERYPAERDTQVFRSAVVAFRALVSYRMIIERPVGRV
jgi:hypothetical protein